MKKEINFTPREIVSELDKYIIGQDKAKRAVAIALRNRWRRMKVEGELKDEILPKNIIMIGPTGVGKTEIARRLAKLAEAPFLKVEASKFTEIGYVGRDVDSMIRDLTQIAINMVKQEETEKVRVKAEQLAEEKILDLLLRPGQKRESPENTDTNLNYAREKLREKLRSGELDSKTVILETDEKTIPMVEIFSTSGSFEEFDINIRDILGNFFPKKTRKRKVTVKEAFKILTEQEAQRLIDMDKVIREAITRVEETGIIFIDEVDKIVSKGSTHGPDVSREGVQRDLLPLIEGSSIPTRYGIVKTNHILFIAAGAFHIAKPSDLLPEFQGRFPIRVELEPLGIEEFKRILVEPKNSLIKQYTAMMKTEGITIEFDPSAIEEIARIAVEMNERMENIGARRLHTIMEKVLEDISFKAPELSGQVIVIDRKYVRERLEDIIKDEDLSKFIL